MTVLRIAGLLTDWADGAGIVPGLIGRDAELAAVDAALTAAMAGHGGCVVITGEPGIGKSRLALETASRAAGPWHPGRDRPGGAAVSDSCLPAAHGRAGAAPPGPGRSR